MRLFNEVADKELRCLLTVKFVVKLEMFLQYRLSLSYLKKNQFLNHLNGQVRFQLDRADVYSKYSISLVRKSFLVSNNRSHGHIHCIASTRDTSISKIVIFLVQKCHK